MKISQAKLMKFVDGLVKTATVIVTAPATWEVAANAVGNKFLLQVAAVTLVEGALISFWLLLDMKRGDPEEQGFYAFSLALLYFGLLCIGLVHGEGAAGVVFRLAMGLAIARSGWEAFSHTWRKATSNADADILTTWVVRRHARRMSRRDAILARDSESRVHRAKVLSQERVEYGKIFTKTEEQLEKLGLAFGTGDSSISNIFPYPIELARRVEMERRAKEKAQSMESLQRLLEDNPDREFTLRQLARAIDRAPSTTASYLQELAGNGRGD